MDDLVSEMRVAGRHFGANVQVRKALLNKGADRIEQLTIRVKELEEQVLFNRRQWHQEAARAEKLENEVRRRWLFQREM